MSALSRAASWAMESLDSENGDQEPSLQRAPSSPSNSWSSGETVPLPSDSPLAEGAEGRRPKRCKISREQLQVLIKSFEEEPLPNFDQRQTLAKLLGMTPRSVQIWFQNRRQRLKPLQPKAASAATPLCGLQAAVAGQRQLHSPTAGRAAQLGMPGLAAAAGLCGGGSHSGIDSLMMSALSHHGGTLGQLPVHQGGHAAHGGFSSLTYGDIMEPFAATKALLSTAGAMGLSPHSHAAAAPTCPPMGLPGGYIHNMASRSPSDSMLRGASAHSGPTSAAAAKSEKADGLLLLLACADGGSAAPELCVAG